MREVNDGGPAFPVLGSRKLSPHAGMLLRDYFAAKAMQGMISADREWMCLDNYEQLSLRAYGIADAMLIARGQQ